ncbi:hypothetical protein HMPREF9406_1247 [Clostridium sp. HGF2]|nr:hypothetical protein HMPREF9406_1247 [Clostridium sp. HGF2]EQJ52369.1 hypothetical protein QSI_3993 [Clostridioides difficile P28]
MASFFSFPGECHGKKRIKKAFLMHIPTRSGIQAKRKSEFYEEEDYPLLHFIAALRIFHYHIASLYELCTCYQ